MKLHHIKANIANRFWPKAMITAIVILFTWFKAVTIDSGHDETIAWIGAFLCIAVFFVIHFLVKGEEQPGWQVPEFLLMTTGILVICFLLWNDLYRFHLKHVDFNQDIFRDTMRSRLTPFYFKIHTSFPGINRLLPMLIIALCYFIWIALRYPAWNKQFVFYTTAYLFLMIIGYAITDGFTERFLSNNVHFSSFNSDKQFFIDIPDLFSTYVEKMHLLSRSAHYPPGNILLFKFEEISFPFFAKGFVIFSTLLTIYPMYQLMKIYGFDLITINTSVLLFAFSTAVPSFASFSLTPVTLPLTTWMVYQVILYIRTFRKRYLVYFGLTACLFLLFSYALTIVGLVISVLFIQQLYLKRISYKQILMAVVITGGSIVLIYGLIYILTGFNQWTCFLQSVANNTASMSMGFDQLGRYLLRSTGNLVAYLASLGIPILAFAIYSLLYIRKLKDEKGFEEIIFSIWIALLLAAFSGLFFLETARIWILFTPIFCIVAGRTITDLLKKDRLPWLLFILLLTLIISIGEELLVDHSFGYFS